MTNKCKTIQATSLSTELFDFLADHSNFNLKDGFIVYVPSISELEAKETLSDDDLSKFRDIIAICEDKPNLIIKE